LKLKHAKENFSGGIVHKKLPGEGILSDDGISRENFPGGICLRGTF